MSAKQRSRALAYVAANKSASRWELETYLVNELGLSESEAGEIVYDFLKTEVAGE